MFSLNNKRILYIGMGFHSYEPIIVSGFEKLGCKVTYVVDAPDSYVKHNTLINETLMNKLISSYQDKLLCELNNIEFEVIFVVVGRYLTRGFLDSLKRSHSGSLFILYLWDDIERVENFWEVHDCYDVIYSFDYNDCLKYGFVFQPLFISPDFELVNSNDINLDVFSVMYLHSDRLDICERMLSNLEIKAGIFFVSGTSNYINLKFNNRISLLKDKGIYISRKEFDRKFVSEGIASTRCVIDIQHPSQRGLTIRTMETIFNHKKLITTNDEIAKYDFYSKDNIFILDRNNPIVPVDFIKSPFINISKDISEKYTLKYWIDNILNCKNSYYIKKG